MRVLGRRRDCPPDLRFSTFTREWNALGLPRLRMTITPASSSASEAAAGAMLPLRGDLTATDYPWRTSRAKELGIFA
jgi:hypothetical protein